MEKSKIKSELQTLINNLVKRDFDEMNVQGLFGVSSLGQVRNVIDSYPGKMTYPPEHEFDCFELYGDLNGDFTIDFALWFNDRQSDLYAVFANRLDSVENRLFIYDIRVL